MKHHRADDEALREFGSLVTKRRQEKGWTSRQMASHLGMSQSGYSRIENGTREIRLEIIRELHAILGIGDSIMKYVKTGRF